MLIIKLLSSYEHNLYNTDISPQQFHDVKRFMLQPQNSQENSHSGQFQHKLLKHSIPHNSHSQSDYYSIRPQ